MIHFWYMEQKIIEAPNLPRLSNKAHEGKWAAISADHQRLVAVNDDLVALEREVRGQAVTLFKVLPSNVGYAPLTSAS